MAKLYIELRCPHCQHALRVGAVFAGSEGNCRFCNGMILVPERPDTAPSLRSRFQITRSSWQALFSPAA